MQVLRAGPQPNRAPELVRCDLTLDSRGTQRDSTGGGLVAIGDGFDGVREHRLDADADADADAERRDLATYSGRDFDRVARDQAELLRRALGR